LNLIYERDKKEKSSKEKNLLKQHYIIYNDKTGKILGVS